MQNKEDAIETLRQYCKRYSDYATLRDLTDNESEYPWIARDPLNRYIDVCFTTAYSLFSFLRDPEKSLLLETQDMTKKQYLEFLGRVPWDSAWVAYLEFDMLDESHGIFLLNLPCCGLAATVQSLSGIYKAKKDLMTPELLRSKLEKLYDNPTQLTHFMTGLVGNVPQFDVAVPLCITPERLPSFTLAQEKLLYLLRKNYLEAIVEPNLLRVMRMLSRYAGERDPDIKPYLRELNTASLSLLS